jgi:uncharacterized membrane protein
MDNNVIEASRSHAQAPIVVPRESLLQLTHLVYALHAFSALAGVLGSAFIVTAFLTGWPSIIAVILNYVKRGDPDVEQSYLASHFSWQIRTFWFAVLWVLIAGLLIVTVIGLPLAWLLAVVTGLWVLYRIVRGWLALVGQRSVGESRA